MIDNLLMANLALYKINMKGLKTHPPIHNNHMETSWCRSYHHCMSAIWKEWSLTSYQQVLSVSSCSTLEFRHYTLWKNLYWWNISIEIRWMFLKVNLNGIWEPQIGSIMWPGNLFCVYRPENLCIYLI